MINASTEASRKPNPPACWISGSAAMTPAPDLVVGGDGLVTDWAWKGGIRAKSVYIDVVMP